MILVIMCMVFIIIGLLLIIFAYNPYFFITYIANILFHYSQYITFPLRIQLALVGILIILLAIKYFGHIFSSKKENVITLETPEGEVSITILAIEDMLIKILETKKELSHIKPRVKVGKKSIEVVIKANLTSEINILDFINETQKELKERLHNVLGTAKEVKVKIEIKKMVFGKNKQLQEEPQIPFRNY